jgi:predicted ester cyclase
MGVAPTGKRATWTGIAIDRIAGGKIAESWVNWDMLGMLQQLGASKPR